MATKKVQIILDVDGKPIDVAVDATLNLKQQFRELTKEINKTKEGTKEFELLSTKLGDVKDSMESTTAKSRDLFGSLSLLPGPVGAFSNSVDSVIGSLKLFSSFSFKDLKFQLGETVNDFKDIASNIGKASGISKVYTVINNALSKSFVAVGVGEQAAAAGARTFAAALTATGIGAIVVALGFLISALMEWVGSTEDADAANKALNDTLKEQERLLANDLKAIDAATKQNILRAKVAGKTEQDLFEIQKKAGQDRLTELRKADEENYKLTQKALKDKKTSQETIDALTKKGLDLNQQIIDQINANEETRLNFEVAQADKRRQKQKENNDKAIAANKQYRDKVAADNKSADEMLLDLQQENAALALKNERERQDQELKNLKADEEAKINVLLISQEKKNTLLAQVDTKYKAKQDDLNTKRKEEDKKKADEDIQARQEALLKLREIEISAIKDEAERAKAERQKRFDTEKVDLKKALDDKKITQEEYNTAIKNLETALANDLAKIKEDADKKEMEKNIKKLDDELKFLQIKGEAIRQGTKADFDNRRAILNAAEARELADTELSEAQKTAIKEKYVKLRKDLDQQEVASYAATAAQTLDALAKLGNAIASSYDEEAKTSKSAFEKRKRLQKATAIMSAASGIIQILAQPSTLPSPFDWITKGINAAALAVATGVQIGNINKTQFEGGGATESGGQNLGKNYEEGGMINGPRHAQGGVLINAEGGEAVMTRGAVTMFAPLLSAMNQMGGGTAFNSNLNQGLPDAPVRDNPALNQQPMVMKTYVVSNELTTEAERQARLKDLSTL